MRVLLAEDQANVATYIKQGLEEQGYVVDVARTGREALEWAQVAHFDLIIMDVMLPELDGLTVCRALRNAGNEAALLMLTARDTVEDRVAGLDAGADDYLVKPFALSELLARLRALTRRRSSKTSILALADLSLDSQTHVVMRQHTLIKLTAKEYAVLEYLMRQANRVVSRTEIAEEVWRHEADSQSNLVDVYIGNLRRKIDDPFTPKLIHTVRGAGYYLAG
jgi:DNA-binding response OmpR family regulator